MKRFLCACGLWLHRIFSRTTPFESIKMNDAEKFAYLSLILQPNVRRHLASYNKAIHTANNRDRYLVKCFMIDKAIVTAKFDNSEFASILLTAGLDAFCRHRLKYCSSIRSQFVLVDYGFHSCLELWNSEL